MEDTAAVDWGFINYRRDFILHNGFQEENSRPMHHADQEHRDIVCLFDNIESLILDTKFFLDTELDIIPGGKTDMLRLERYATWFPDGDGFETLPYQQRILTVLRLGASL